MINWNTNTEQYVNKNRQFIKEEFLKSYFKGGENFNNGVTQVKNFLLDSKGVERLFYSYDKSFFNGQLKSFLGSNISFSVSNRMTSSGGKTIYKKAPGGNHYEIRISAVILNNFYLNKSEKRVSGILVSDPIEALLIIMEHEICHVIEFYNHGNSNCKGARFKKLSTEVFKHKGIYHDIPTTKKLSAPSKSLNIHIGDKVSFNFKNKRYQGVVVNITKRATVMVLDKRGVYKDKEGSRYTKWYVPINNLSKGIHEEVLTY